ncbi:MAG: hypothetical protein KGI33_11995 [Thaumarchaeota archaeon]|nr:hypothetical protein [Nitrososphaerota archaeon]
MRDSRSSGCGKRYGMRSRQAFGLDSLIMIISAIVIIAIMVGISRTFMTTLEDSYVSLTTTMPTFGYLGNSTVQQNSTSVQGASGSLLSVYNMLRSGTIWALGGVLVIAAILFMLEQIEVVPASTAFGMISKGALYVLLLFAFPPVWDLYAAGIEDASRAIMDPLGTGQVPPSVATVFGTINGMGISQGRLPQVNNALFGNLIQLFNGKDIVSSFQDQGKAFILGLVGGLIALVASFLTYMFASIRQVLTAVLVAGLPVILVLSLVPWFRGIARRLLDTLFGLSIVPVFSSLVMVTGAAYLGSISAHPVEEQWFASVAVLTLATFVPTILVPLLGSLFGSMTNMVSSGIGFGGTMATFAARTGQGLAGGVLGAVGSVRQGGVEFGAPYSRAGMARAGIIGGAVGVLGGLAQGASHAGAQMLGRIGGGAVAPDVRRMGTGAAERMQEAARNEGARVIQPSIDRTLTGNSAFVMGKLAAIPVPQEQRAAFLQSGSNLLGIAREAIQTGNYSGILEHPYFSSVPVKDKVTFARTVSSTIVNHGSDPGKLANISYNLHKMGGLTNENMREFMRNEKIKRTSHNTDKSQTLDENPIA